MSRAIPLFASALVAGLIASAGASAQPSSDLEARARAAHAKALVVDSHADVPLDFGVGGHEAAVDGDTQVDLPKLKRGGVGAVALAVFVPQGPRTPEGVAKARADADTKLAAIGAAAARHPDQAELALSADDVRRIHREGKVAILASFLNAYPFGKDLAPIDDYYRAGVRVFGLVHAGNNDYADSSRPSGQPAAEWGGLSPVGKAAIARLNRLGVLIDVSQLSSEGFRQVLAESRAPVVATHSGVRGMVDSPRNLSDGELDALKANGGVIQIVAFSTYLVRPPADYPDRVRALRRSYGLAEAYAHANDGVDALAADRRAAFNHDLAALTRPGTVKDLVDSIDYAVRRIGVDHVGIASDFNHGGGVEGFRNEGEALNVTRELVGRGYSDADIAKLWGGNFLRVLGQAETTGSRLAAAAPEVVR